MKPTGNMRYVLRMMAQGLPFGSAPTKATWDGLIRRGLVWFDAGKRQHELTQEGKALADELSRERGL